MGYLYFTPPFVFVVEFFPFDWGTCLLSSYYPFFFPQPERRPRSSAPPEWLWDLPCSSAVLSGQRLTPSTRSLDYGKDRTIPAFLRSTLSPLFPHQRSSCRDLDTRNQFSPPRPFHVPQVGRGSALHPSSVGFLPRTHFHFPPLPSLSIFSLSVLINVDPAFLSPLLFFYINPSPSWGSDRWPFCFPSSTNVPAPLEHLDFRSSSFINTAVLFIPCVYQGNGALFFSGLF